MEKKKNNPHHDSVQLMEARFEKNAHWSSSPELRQGPSPGPQGLDPKAQHPGSASSTRTTRISLDLTGKVSLLLGRHVHE